jgi:hypothetical protein
MQRMGGINDFVLTADDRFVISVGQDRKIVVWENSKAEAIYSCWIDDENDEGFSIAM